MLRISTSKRLFYLFLFFIFVFFDPCCNIYALPRSKFESYFPPLPKSFFGARTPYCNITILYKSLIFMFSIIDSFVFVGFDFGFGSV